MSFIDAFNSLSADEQAAIIAGYDALERKRVHAEWTAEGAFEHDCCEDIYCGGCSMCGQAVKS